MRLSEASRSLTRGIMKHHDATGFLYSNLTDSCYLKLFLRTKEFQAEECADIKLLKTQTGNAMYCDAVLLASHVRYRAAANIEPSFPLPHREFLHGENVPHYVQLQRITPPTP